jgi:hypothetical protein
MAAPLADDREAAGLEGPQLADDAVAATMPARPAGAEPQGISLDADRVGELERLGWGRERVRHRDVHRRRTVGIRAGALTAADRLVVREVVAAEGDVVHRPLALRRNVDRLAQREEDDVGDPARGLNVAGRDRGRRSRIDEGPLRRADGDGREGTT